MKHVLVTGACGGLGSRVCELLTAEGAAVYATDAARAGLRRLAGKPGMVPLLMDVTRAADLARVHRRIAAEVDGLDWLVCCAGIFSAGPLVESSESGMRRILDVNVMGAFLTVKEFFPLLRKRGGTVVLVGSESSRGVMPFNGPYTVSKAALQAYADALRRELMFVGVRVALVMPGAIRTPLLAGARQGIERQGAATLFPAQLGLVQRMLVKEYEKAMDPTRVAKVVLAALRDRRPRPFYHVGNNPLRVLLGRLPAAWADRLIWRVASRPPADPSRRSKARKTPAASSRTR